MLMGWAALQVGREDIMIIQISLKYQRIPTVHNRPYQDVYKVILWLCI